VRHDWTWNEKQQTRLHPSPAKPIRYGHDNRRAVNFLSYIPTLLSRQFFCAVGCVFLVCRNRVLSINIRAGAQGWQSQ
jgi:hypothetical protein